MKKGKKRNPTNGSQLGFEATLWATADKLRGNLDAAEYKHVVLGHIFLKYISDAIEERVIDLVSTIGLGDKESRSMDIIGRVYEYFLSVNSPAPKARKGANSIRPAASSSSSLR